MATKKKPGRPRKTPKEKVKTKYIYITDGQEQTIKKGFQSLTKAVLAKCE
jgi:hypothetical protein